MSPRHDTTTASAIRAASATPCAFGNSAGSVVSCRHSIRYDGGQRGWPQIFLWTYVRPARTGNARQILCREFRELGEFCL